MNNVIEVHQPVTGIVSEENSFSREQLYPGEEAVSDNGDFTDELDTLPLSDFERDMARLQQTPEEKGLPEIIGKLEENYAKERENIYNSGFQAGIDTGRKEMKQQFQEDITSLERLIREMESSQWRIKKEAELGMINLSLQIARQIIKAEITLNPETIRHIIKETLDYTQNLEILSLELNPKDYTYISQHSKITNELPDNIQMKKNAGIARGGCIVHTNMESIDAKVETKLEHLAEQLYQNATEEG